MEGSGRMTYPPNKAMVGGAFNNLFVARDEPLPIELPIYKKPPKDTCVYIHRCIRDDGATGWYVGKTKHPVERFKQAYSFQSDLGVSESYKNNLRYLTNYRIVDTWLLTSTGSWNPYRTELVEHREIYDENFDTVWEEERVLPPIKGTQFFDADYAAQIEAWLIDLLFPYLLNRNIPRVGGVIDV